MTTMPQTQTGAARQEGLARTTTTTTTTTRTTTRTTAGRAMELTTESAASMPAETKVKTKFNAKFNESVAEIGLEAWEGTLATSVALKGCGVHSGKDVNVELHPSEQGSGIVLRRTDLANGKRDIPLRYERVEERQLCTKVVGEAGTAVSMVEHLMCALAIAQIDNLLVLLDADELPILDGSAEPWLKAIFEAGIVRQKKPRRYLVVQKPVEAREGDRFCRLLPPILPQGMSQGMPPAMPLEETTEFPSATMMTPMMTTPMMSPPMMSPSMMTVDFLIDFPHPKVGRQRLQFSTSSREDWREQIASARTFAFKEDIALLRKQNFALGGSLDNAVLIDEQGIVNPEGLRYKDELVRHKILDLCGDLYLAGMPIIARVEACKSGHRLNNRLLHALFQDAQAWREVYLPSPNLSHAPPPPSSSPSSL